MLELPPEEVEVLMKRGRKKVLGKGNSLEKTLGQEVDQRP